MTKRRIGLYPGTFDPITNGHIDIIVRAATHLADELLVGVARNIGKGPMFNVDERVQMVRDQAAIYEAKLGISVTVKSFDNLLVEFAKDNGVELIVRGLRAVSDFEYEFQMASMNRCLDDDIETAFLMASDRNHFISSRFVKEIGQLGGDISQFVPTKVAEMVRHKFTR